MTVRRILAATAATTAIAGAVSLSLAPLAHAADTHHVTLTCQAPVTIYGAAGDTFNFTMASTCSRVWELYNTLDWSQGPNGFLNYVTSVNTLPGSGTGPGEWFYYSDGSGTSVITTTLLATNINGDPLTEGGKVAQVDDDLATGFFDILYGGSAAPSAASPDQTPAPVQQAVGMPASGSCADIQDPNLNWGGAPSGGWSPSWHQWANDGVGGSICQRTLSYVSDGSWTVR